MDSTMVPVWRSLQAGQVNLGQRFKTSDGLVWRRMYVTGAVSHEAVFGVPMGSDRHSVSMFCPSALVSAECPVELKCTTRLPANSLFTIPDETTRWRKITVGCTDYALDVATGAARPLPSRKVIPIDDDGKPERVEYQRTPTTFSLVGDAQAFLVGQALYTKGVNPITNKRYGINKGHIIVDFRDDDPVETMS